MHVVARAAKLFTDPGILRACGRQCAQGTAFCAKLQLTCKTHKPQGAVLHRNLHAASNHVFGGLSKLVSTLLEQPHILLGTQQFVRELLQRPFPDGCWMIRVDVAHFL